MVTRDVTVKRPTAIHEVKLIFDGCDDSTTKEIADLLATTKTPMIFVQFLAQFLVEKQAVPGSQDTSLELDLSPLALFDLPDNFIFILDCCLSVLQKVASSETFFIALRKTKLPHYLVKIMNTFMENKLLIKSDFRQLLSCLMLLHDIFKTEDASKSYDNDAIVMALVNIYINFQFHIEDLVILVRSFCLMITAKIISEDNSVFLLAEETCIDFLLDILRKCFVTKEKYPNYKGIYALDLANAVENFAAIESLKERLIDNGAVELLVTVIQEGDKTDDASAVQAINSLLCNKGLENCDTPILLSGIQSQSENSSVGSPGTSGFFAPVVQAVRLGTIKQDVRTPSMKDDNQPATLDIKEEYPPKTSDCRHENQPAMLKDQCECQVTSLNFKGEGKNKYQFATSVGKDSYQTELNMKIECQSVTLNEHQTMAANATEHHSTVMNSSQEGQTTVAVNTTEAILPPPNSGELTVDLDISDKEVSAEPHPLTSAAKSDSIHIEGSECLQTWEPDTLGKQVQHQTVTEKEALEMLIKDAELNADAAEAEKLFSSVKIHSCKGFQSQAYKNDHLSGEELSSLHDQLVAQGFHNMYDEKTSQFLNDVLSEEKLFEKGVFSFLETWPKELCFNLRKCGSMERNLRVVPAKNLGEMEIPCIHVQPELDYHLVLKKFAFWSIPQMQRKYPGFTLVGPWSKVPFGLEELEYFFTKTVDKKSEVTLGQSRKAEQITDSPEDNAVFFLSATKLRDSLFIFALTKFAQMSVIFQHLLAEGKSTNRDNLSKYGITILKPPEENGPAVTLTHTCNNLLVDYVLALRFIQWPTCAAEWPIREQRSWPTNKTVSDIVKTGCHLVPKQPPSLPETNVNYGLYWQFSFAAAENILLSQLNKDIPVLADCLRMLKFVREHHLDRPELLKSYHLQTVTLWAAERCAISHWKKDNFLGHLLDLLDDLMHYLINFNLPNYFIPNQNLFENFSQEFLIDVAQRISAIRRNPAKYLIASEDPSKFGIYVM